jgi:hypothetical protein
MRGWHITGSIAKIMFKLRDKIILQYEFYLSQASVIGGNSSHGNYLSHRLIEAGLAYPQHNFKVR